MKNRINWYAITSAVVTAARLEFPVSVLVKFQEMSETPVSGDALAIAKARLK